MNKNTIIGIIVVLVIIVAVPLLYWHESSPTPAGPAPSVVDQTASSTSIASTTTSTPDSAEPIVPGKSPSSTQAQ